MEAGDTQPLFDNCVLRAFCSDERKVGKEAEKEWPVRYEERQQSGVSKKSKEELDSRRKR